MNPKVRSRIIECEQEITKLECQLKGDELNEIQRARLKIFVGALKKTLETYKNVHAKQENQEAIATSSFKTPS